MAVKIERQIKSDKNMQMSNEERLLNFLGSVPSVPNVITSSEETFENGQVHRTLIMERKGENLVTLMNTMKNRRFNLATSLTILHQMLISVGDVHAKGIIHRDIKPENFVMGNEK